MFFFSLFARGIGRMSSCRPAAVLEGFHDLPYYRYLVLGTTYYIKSDKIDEEHGYTGGTSSFRPPGHRYLPTLQSELTETTSLVLTYPTLPGRFTCMSSSHIAVQCSAVQADRQTDFTR